MSVVLTHPEIALQKPHWLAGVDSNLQMSCWKMPFEMSHGFRLIPKHLGTRDFSTNRLILRGRARDARYNGRAMREPPDVGRAAHRACCRSRALPRSECRRARKRR